MAMYKRATSTHQPSLFWVQKNANGDSLMYTMYGDGDLFRMGKYTDSKFMVLKRHLKGTIESDSESVSGIFDTSQIASVVFKNGDLMYTGTDGGKYTLWKEQGDPDEDVPSEESKAGAVEFFTVISLVLMLAPVLAVVVWT